MQIYHSVYCQIKGEAFHVKYQSIIYTLSRGLPSDNAEHEIKDTSNQLFLIGSHNIYKELLESMLSIVTNNYERFVWYNCSANPLPRLNQHCSNQYHINKTSTNRSHHGHCLHTFSCTLNIECIFCTYKKMTIKLPNTICKWKLLHVLIMKIRAIT